MLAVFPLTTTRASASGATITPWGHLTYQQVPLQVSQKRGGELALHTSGSDCNWLKATIVKKVIVFSVFVKLGIRVD